MPLWDHPRICGEKYSGLFEQQNDAGITPAYAGKSASESHTCRADWDHPRVCGEKLCIDFLIEHCLGSPPRMRGKVKHHSSPLYLVGITPAYAGKRISFTLLCSAA